MSSFIDHFLPDDDSQKSVRKYRLMIAGTSYSVWTFVFAILVPFLITAFWVGFPDRGTVVWASEIDKKVADAVAPIHKDVADIKVAVQALTEANKRSAAAALGQTIITATRDRCRAIAAGRSADALADRILDLRREYKNLTGEHFQPLTCSDV